jgi:hypothetical protein
VYFTYIWFILEVSTTHVMLEWVFIFASTIIYNTDYYSTHWRLGVARDALAKLKNEVLSSSCECYLIKNRVSSDTFN